MKPDLCNPPYGAAALPIAVKPPKLTFVTFLCTLNLALIAFGYAFASSLLQPLGYNIEQSQLISIPFRIFALAVSVICAAIALLRGTQRPKISAFLAIFFICISLGIFRILFDLLYDVSGYAQREFLRVCGFLATSFFAALSVFLTHKLIRYDVALVMMLLMGTFVIGLLPLGLVTPNIVWDQYDSMVRTSSSAALFSIAYGFVGTLTSLLALFVLSNKKYGILSKILSIVVILLGIEALFSSGSRSPLFALFVVLVVYAATLVRDYMLVILGIVFMGIIAYLLRMEITNIVSQFAPLLGSRLESMFLDYGFSGRDILAVEGMRAAIDNPILGVSTINTSLGLSPLIGYHSAIVDSFANYGFIAGSLFVALLIYLVYISISILIYRKRVPNYWVAMILLGYLALAIPASGLFVTNPSFAAFSVLGIIFYDEYVKPLKN